MDRNLISSQMHSPQYLDALRVLRSRTRPLTDERKQYLRDRYRPIASRPRPPSQMSRFLDAFLSGKAEAAESPEFAELAAVVTATYAASAWRTAMERGTTSPPMPTIAPEDEEAVIDVIMVYSYTAESLETGVTRLARAVQHLGFSRITPFAAMAAYQTFPHLSEVPYVGRR